MNILNEIIETYMAGKEAIADRLGVKRRTLYNWLQQPNQMKVELIKQDLEKQLLRINEYLSGNGESKVHLLNAANMPQSGSYLITKIAAEEFAAKIQQAAAADQLESYIGYEDNVRFIRSLSGITVELELNRKTVLTPGDTLLIMKLKKRVSGQQLRQLTLTDFEYFRCLYN